MVETLFVICYIIIYFPMAWIFALTTNPQVKGATFFLILLGIFIGLCYIMFIG